MHEFLCSHTFHKNSLYWLKCMVIYKFTFRFLGANFPFKIFLFICAGGCNFGKCFWGGGRWTMAKGLALKETLQWLSINPHESFVSPLYSRKMSLLLPIVINSLHFHPFANPKRSPNCHFPHFEYFTHQKCVFDSN